MIKKIIKFSFYLFVLLILIISYLSTVGIETNKLNEKIKKEVLKINKEVNLELNSVKILLNLRDLSVNIKTFDPKIIFNNQKLELNYVKTNISIKSLFEKKFSIDEVQVLSKTIKLKNIVSLSRSFKNSAQLFLLERSIKDGFMIADINLNFDSNGKIKKNYKINGSIKKGKFNLIKKENINNLNLTFKIEDQKFLFETIQVQYNNIKLTSKFIEVIKKKDLFLIKGNLKNKEDKIEIEQLKKFLGKTFNKLNLKNLSIISNNNFNFDINNKFKINNFTLDSKIKLNNLDFKNNMHFIRNYLPNFKDEIKLMNHNIQIYYKKNNLKITGKGELENTNLLHNLDYKILKKKNDYIFDTNININNDIILIDVLNFKKKKNQKALLNLNGVYKSNKEITFKSITLTENDNLFSIKNLNLTQDFKILNVDLIDLNYKNKNKIKNQVLLKRLKSNYEIKGKVFDATNLINNILNENDSNSFSNVLHNFSSNLDIQIDNVYLDKENITHNFAGKINFNKNKVKKLNLVSFFSENKKVALTVETKENNTVTTLFSDHAKPFVKRYKFIKGFEEGVLDFQSIKKNNISKSILKIDNFKIQEIPVLAKLLTLASLQGIADLLTGEGIRFTDFEMAFSNKDKLTTFDEIYAIGPAISIMMDGYIESKKLISLRGTLVPATTINRTISSIPLIGDLLVGKKVGEGVFGVSFKIKGPPKNLKTSVNPIKTLTPRFITRTLEKIKKD